MNALDLEIDGGSCVTTTDRIEVTAVDSDDELQRATSPSPTPIEPGPWTLSASPSVAC